MLTLHIVTYHTTLQVQIKGRLVQNRDCATSTLKGTRQFSSLVISPSSHCSTSALLWLLTSYGVISSPPLKPNNLLYIIYYNNNCHDVGVHLLSSLGSPEGTVGWTGQWNEAGLLEFVKPAPARGLIVGTEQAASGAIVFPVLLVQKLCLRIAAPLLD